MHQKEIDCPEHGETCKAVLYTYGHKYAGIWECKEYTDSCEHPETETQEATNNTLTMSGVREDRHKVDVCSACGVVVEKALA